MARIDMGQFGYQVAEPVRGPRATEAPQTGQAIQAVGEGLQRVADAMYRREAIADSTKILYDATKELDVMRLTYEQPKDENGVIKFDPSSKDYLQEVSKDFDARSKKLMDAAKRRTNNRAALEVIDRDLTSRLENTRKGIMTKSLQLRADSQKAATLEVADNILANPAGKPVNEVMTDYRRHLEAAVQVGAIDHTEAFTMAEKGEQRLLTNQYVMAMGASGSTSQLAKVQELITADPQLKPETKLSLTSVISTRRTQIEQEAEKALKAEQEGINKTLTDLFYAKQLTPSIVETFRTKLSADQYGIWKSRFSEAAVKGQDDPKTVLDLTSAIRGAWKDQAALIRLRDRVAAYGSGYDPVTKSSGTPRISVATEERLNATIESYLNDLRSEGQRVKTDAEQAADRRYQSVRSILLQKLQVQKAAVGKDEKADVEQMEADILEGLERSRKDPEAYLQQLRKDRPSLFKPPVPEALRFYLPQKGNSAPDWEGAARRMYEDYRRSFDKATDPKRKQSLTNQYNQDYEAMKRFRREWDAAQ